MNLNNINASEKILVQLDPFLFYSCGMISFLESRVDTYVENLEPFFECDKGTMEWLKTVWLPEEAEHGNLMRGYVQRVWPDFNWEEAFDEFSRSYMPQCATEKLRASVSLEALARCVTETETSMIYRCISFYAQEVDEELSSLLKRMSTDEVRHYSVFKKIHKRHEIEEQNGFIKRLKVLIGRTQLIRDEDLALAFMPLNKHWRKSSPFAHWEYNDFISNTNKVMSDYFPYKEAKRMLFNPFRESSRFSKLIISIASILLDRIFSKYA